LLSWKETRYQLNDPLYLERARIKKDSTIHYSVYNLIYIRRVLCNYLIFHVKILFARMSFVTDRRILISLTLTALNAVSAYDNGARFSRLPTLVSTTVTISTVLH